MQQDETALVQIMSEIRDWMRVGFRSEVKDALNEFLDDPRKAKAYMMTDGDNTVESIRKSCNMSPNSLLKFWRQGEQMGLIRVLSGGKRQRIFDPEALGIQLTPAEGEQ